jgi:peroxiredoxin family protein
VIDMDAGTAIGSREIDTTQYDAALHGLAKELDAHEKHGTKHDKLVIFAWSGDLDRVWPTFILATTAAAMGMKTIVFFTFWGLFPLVRNDVRITGENWMQRMMSVMHRGGTEHLHLSQMDFAGMGPAMMKKLAEEHHVASPQELLEVARDLGVQLIPCGMTMDLLGLTKDDLIDGLAEPAGATTALAEAQDAVTLFI